MAINEKPWTRSREVCKALWYEEAARRVFRNDCTKENIQHKHQLAVAPTVGTTVNWPRDSQKLDLYINWEGMYELLFSSQQKALLQEGTVVLIPHVRLQLANKIQEEHQQTITDRDNQIQALKFTNEAHQQKILRLNEEINDLIANRHVARRGCFGNVLSFIKKNSKEV